MIRIHHNPPPAAPSTDENSSVVGNAIRRRIRKGQSVPPLICPFTVIRDTQERAGGWPFLNILADANKQHRPILIPTEEAHLKTGDYSIKGLESLVTVERKSKSDLYGTLASGRARFTREHERMREMIRAGGYACVLIEASMADAINDPPFLSRLNPKTVFRTAVSWPIKFGVHWIWAEDRRAAEVTCFRILEKFWQQSCERKKTKQDIAVETGGNTNGNLF